MTPLRPPPLRFVCAFHPGSIHTASGTGLVCCGYGQVISRWINTHDGISQFVSLEVISHRDDTLMHLRPPVNDHMTDDRLPHWCRDIQRDCAW